jgi:DNA-binding PadR family transcriptional regulator
MHAFEITRWIEERSDKRVLVDDAALLQALHRMEERRLIVAEWGVTEKGRRARYYRLTAAGRAHLKAETERLVDHFDALVTILSAKRA